MSNTELHLEALMECIEKIEKYSNDFLNADDFYYDSKSFDATMMQFIVIGETISRLDNEFKASQAQIPWKKIKDFRNIIAHDYFGIDPEEIWDIIKEKLLPLKNDIAMVLENHMHKTLK